MSPLSLVRARYARNDHWLTHCQAVAHDTDVVAQQIHHALISDRHLELICLLLELIEARHQLNGIGRSAAARDLVLQESQLAV